MRASVALLALLAAGSWLLGGFPPASLWSERGRANAARFLGELRPWPLRGEAPDAAAAVDWALTLWRGHDAVALLNTLAISVAAIGLAGAAGALLSLAAARNLSCPRPFLPGGRPPGRTVVWAWRAVVLGAGRPQITLGAVYPLTMPRFLLYFFYRWETCVREATVLGMLGMGCADEIVSGRARRWHGRLSSPPAHTA